VRTVAGFILSVYIGLCILGLLAPKVVVVNPDLTVTVLEQEQP
jgi:hypothetical protein